MFTYRVSIDNGDYDLFLDLQNMIGFTADRVATNPTMMTFIVTTTEAWMDAIGYVLEGCLFHQIDA